MEWEGTFLNSFYETSITPIPKSDKDIIRKLQINIPDEYRCKTSQQNTSKSNPATHKMDYSAGYCCWVASVVSDSVWPHRQQPTRLLHSWGSPGKNIEVGCHFLLQWVKVKSFSHVWLFETPWTAAYQAPPSMGFSRQEYWSGLPSPSPIQQDQVRFSLGMQDCFNIQNSTTIIHYLNRIKVKTILSHQ